MAPPDQSPAGLATRKRLALAICDFLTASVADGTLAADDKDSVDVAVNCIAESFKVDPSNRDAVKAAVGSQSLLQIFSAYQESTSADADATPNASDSSRPSASATQPSDEQKKEAESLKNRGNAAMAQKDYPSAIGHYTKALDLHPSNPVYLSNRAAAHSAAKDHHSARLDAEAAVAVDPSYTKAWSRLGLARFALGDAKGAMEAYAKGIEYEGSGGSDAMKKGYETAKRRVEELRQQGDDPSARASPSQAAGGLPDLSSLASMLGGGAGGAGGGMPDLGSIMSNPMFANMAQNLMGNPDLMNNLMSNPRLREMANQFTSGGGMPDLNGLMSDPNIAEMARNMMGGGAAGDSGNNNNNQPSQGRPGP